MATIINFNGFETGDFLQATIGVSGGVSIVSTPTRSGDNALKVPPSGRYQFSIFENVTKVDDGYVFGWAFQYSALPSVETDLLRLTGGGDTSLQLSLQSGGDIVVRQDGGSIPTGGTATDPMDAGGYAYLELFVENTNSGAFNLMVDKVSVASGTGDFLGAAVWDKVELRNSAAGAVADLFFDDTYILNGATGIADRLTAGDKTVEIFNYQQTDGGATERGTTLANSTTWADASQKPAVQGSGNRAEYDTNPSSGEMITDSGSRSGPSGDSRIDGDSNIAAALFLFRASGNGSFTGNIRYGNNVDTVQEDAVSITTSVQTFIRVSEDPDIVPLSNQFFVAGMRLNTANELYADEIFCQILHLGDVAGALTFPQQSLAQLGVGI